MYFLPTLFFLFLALPADAQQNRGSGQIVLHEPSAIPGAFYANSWAVVIGMYQYEKWTPLQYAVNDAKAVRDKLITLGFPAANISMLTEKITSRHAYPWTL
jgi:hypothetical protein